MTTRAATNRAGLVSEGRNIVRIGDTTLAACGFLHKKVQFGANAPLGLPIRGGSWFGCTATVLLVLLGRGRALRGGTSPIGGRRNRGA